jgi:hypothetical protein
MIGTPTETAPRIIDQRAMPLNWDMRLKPAAAP